MVLGYTEVRQHIWIHRMLDTRNPTALKKGTGYTSWQV